MFLRQPRLLVILLLVCLLGVSAIPASPALAATECNSELTGVTIQGNLTVTGGGSCLLIGSTVTGNVTVSANVGFYSSGTTIQGKVSGAGVYSVVLDSGTVVKGSVAVSGAFSSLSIVSSWVNGNLTLTGNPLNDPLTVANSMIGGNLTVSGNSSNFGSPLILNNSVGGNLSCVDNDPAPVSVGSNVVSGRKTGQCAGL